jgi:hypothetical protein
MIRRLLLLISAMELLVLFNALGQEKIKGTFLIREIVSQRKYYIIYAEKNDSLFKIVSDKSTINVAECNKIVVGNLYNLYLCSNIPRVNGIKVLPANYLDVVSPFTPGQTVWSIEPDKGIFDTYHTIDIIGLCIAESTNINFERGIIFPKEYNPKIIISDLKDRFTPNDRIISKAEKLILLQFKNRLKKYQRQYVGYIDNQRDSLILIQFLKTKSQTKMNKYYYNWKNEYIVGFGNFYENNTRRYIVNINNGLIRKF